MNRYLMTCFNSQVCWHGTNGALSISVSYFVLSLSVSVCRLTFIYRISIASLLSYPCLFSTLLSRSRSAFYIHPLPAALFKQPIRDLSLCYPPAPSVIGFPFRVIIHCLCNSQNSCHHHHHHHHHRRRRHDDTLMVRCNASLRYATVGKLIFGSVERFNLNPGFLDERQRGLNQFVQALVGNRIALYVPCRDVLLCAVRWGAVLCCAVLLCGAACRGSRVKWEGCNCGMESNNTEAPSFHIMLTCMRSSTTHA